MSNQGQDVALHIKPKLTGPTSNLFVCPSRPNKAVTARRRGGDVGVGDVTFGDVAVVKLTVGGNAPESKKFFFLDKMFWVFVINK